MTWSGGDAPKTRPLEAADLECDFRTGGASVDAYFRNHALTNHDRAIARVFVLPRTAEDGGSLPFVGFYSLSSASIEPAVLPKKVGRGLPRYPTPAVLIGQFGIDERHQGQGLGKTLLADALLRIGQIADQIGVFLVLVDAKDEKALTFYLRFGFLSVNEDMVFPRKLYLPMKTVRNAHIG